MKHESSCTTRNSSGRNRNPWPLIVLVVWLPCVGLEAQQVKIPSQIVPLKMTSGPKNFVPGAGTLEGNGSLSLAYEETVRAEGAPWVQLKFGAHQLGKRSVVEVMSIEDGGRQLLDSKRMAQWRGISAAFNGEAVRVRLYVAPEDEGMFIDIGDMIVGDRLTDTNTEDEDTEESLCVIGNDERVSNIDPRIARIRPTGCTGWLIASGEFLTAGHCTDGSGANMQFVEFNVPASESDGALRNAQPEDQYSVDSSSIRFFDDGLGQVGNDWAVFRVFQNSQTGRTASESQGDFVRISDRSDSVVTIRVTGFGVDTVPPGTGMAGRRNSDNQTLQTDAGLFLGEDLEGPSSVRINYLVDTTSGNSGSPAIDEDTGVAIGIHTNAGCNPPSQGNQGTSFRHRDLMVSMEQFPAVDTIYVDPQHPVAREDGSIFRPFDSIAEALEAVEDGGTISISSGTFREKVELTKTVTFHTPSGPVVIEDPQ